MGKIEFKIKFITPLLIHGADKQPDAVGLAKALRGAWRFWFRAMVGGLVSNISKEDLFKLESDVFGSANEKIGAKFRMVVETESLPAEGRIGLGFNRNGGEQEVPGYPAGCTFKITILPRRVKNNNEEVGMSDGDVNILLATIFLWSLLGSVGQRERRGFGSPVIELVNNGNPFKCGTCNLEPKLAFTTSSEIEGYLKQNLCHICDIFLSWLQQKGNPATGCILTNEVPTAPFNFFVLTSIGQIAVGTQHRSMADIHGKSSCRGLGYAGSNGRIASPVFTRLYKVNGGFLPIATFANQGLQNCTSHNCVKNYLINFCKMTNWLDGTVI